LDGFDIIVGVQRWEMADSAMMNNEVAKAMRGKGIGEDEGNWGTEENTFDWIKEWMGTVGMNGEMHALAVVAMSRTRMGFRLNRERGSRKKNEFI